MWENFGRKKNGEFGESLAIRHGFPCQYKRYGKIVLGRFIDFATFTKFFFVNNLSNYTTSEYTMYIAIYSRVLHVFYMGLLKHKFTIT